jgi:hypothetical protein
MKRKKAGIEGWRPGKEISFAVQHIPASGVIFRGGKPPPEEKRTASVSKPVSCIRIIKD